MLKKNIIVSVASQNLTCFEEGTLLKRYPVSTAKNGVGEQLNSECTPRGQHAVYQILGLGHAENSVFIAREWTGEIYTKALAEANPERDWILTRIIWLAGLEPGFNQGVAVDTQSRFIYIHGTPDETSFEAPGSHGCIRMCNQDMIALADWATVGTSVLIEE
ncbi:MAG: L,D-transpeptidase [Gammaproteobacteria bacterium]|nr:L,D-transpeptidase [Gammaproteobacteria bacterium]MCH9762794.1 L,D-transpeptidase [Gammaproteobacteria bacterium]